MPVPLNEIMAEFSADEREDIECEAGRLIAEIARSASCGAPSG